MAAHRYNYQRRLQAANPRAVVVLVLLVVVMFIGGIIFFGSHKTSFLPSDIQKQVSFVAFVPDKPWIVDQKAISYQSSSQVLTLEASQKDKTIVLKEQPAPSQFADIPQYYPALLNKLNQFQSIGTANGTVNLIRPTEVGKEEAIVYDQGTLIFVTPNKDLSTDDWRQLFNNMNIVK